MIYIIIIINLIYVQDERRDDKKQNEIETII